MLSSIAQGTTQISNFLNSRDTLTTLKAFRRLGVDIKYDRRCNEVLIKGKGKFLKSKAITLSMGESGTTIRIISGLLSAQKFWVTLSCRPSLGKRPMARITRPLRAMGADIKGKVKGKEEFPPLVIKPARSLKGIRYRLPVASAQVKSCLLLAGIYAKGQTTIIEPYKSRDHTERMLKVFKASIEVKARTVTIGPSNLISSKNIIVPSDFSSAAYFISLGLLSERSNLLIKRVSVNPTRTGLLRVLRRMGADIKLRSLNKNYFEPYADILVKSCRLKSTVIREEEIPLMIDEIPLVFVLASFAKGRTKIYGLRELKVKETDRIYSMEFNLRRMGVNFAVRNYTNSRGARDVMVEIIGPTKFKNKKIRSFSDHRTAMSLITANLAQEEPAEIDDISCISKSFPEFFDILKSTRKY